MTYAKRPTRTHPPKVKTERPARQKVTLTVPSELMNRLATFEQTDGYRTLNLSALLSNSLKEWLDAHEVPAHE